MKKNSSYWYCPNCKQELDGCGVTAEIKSLKKELKTAVKVLDDICKNGCSWEIGSKECVESGCPVAQWREMEGKEWRGQEILNQDFFLNDKLAECELAALLKESEVEE